MLTGSKIIGYVGVWLSKIELLNTEAETCSLLAVSGMVCLQSLIIHELKKNSTTSILQLIKSHETEPPGRRLVTCWASAHGPFRLGKSGLGFWREDLDPERRVPANKWFWKENNWKEDPGNGGKYRRSGRCMVMWLQVQWDLGHDAQGR